MMFPRRNSLWIAPLLLVCIAPWRINALSSSPVVPQDVEALTQQVHELRHQLSYFEDPSSQEDHPLEELPWKEWYKEAEERNRLLSLQQQSQSQNYDDDSFMQVECLETALAMADAERDCLAAELQQTDVAYATLQQTLDTVRQHHAENCASLQLSLDKAEDDIVKVQQQSVAHCLMLQQMANIQLDATVVEYEMKWGLTRTELQQTQARLQQRELKLEKRGSRIMMLEREKKSLRKLAKNSVHLIFRRFNKRAERLVKKSRGGGSSSSQGGGSSSSTSASYVLPQQSQWSRKTKSATPYKEKHNSKREHSRLPNHHPHVPHASWSLLPAELEVNGN